MNIIAGEFFCRLSLHIKGDMPGIWCMVLANKSLASLDSINAFQGCLALSLLEAEAKTSHTWKTQRT